MSLGSARLIHGDSKLAAHSSRPLVPRTVENGKRLLFSGTSNAELYFRAFEETRHYEPKQIAAAFPVLLDQISQKRVGDRLDRHEPRAVKRRPKPYPLLMMPRPEAKRWIERG